jgi:hypothetical protein
MKTHQAPFGVLPGGRKLAERTQKTLPWQGFLQ